MKKIYFTKHSLDQIIERKTSKEEVIEVIKECIWKKAKKGRFSSAKTFKYCAEHFGKYYDEKDVVPIL